MRGRAVQGLTRLKRVKNPRQFGGGYHSGIAADLVDDKEGKARASVHVQGYAATCTVMLGNDLRCLRCRSRL